MNAAIIFLVSSLFIGCITNANHLIAPEHMISIKQTTKEEVQRLLGPPNWLQKFPNKNRSHERWSYWWSGGRHINKINALLKVGSLASRIDTHASRAHLHGLTIAFSKDGRVQSITRHASRGH